jgi:hypothetical protein
MTTTKMSIKEELEKAAKEYAYKPTRESERFTRSDLEMAYYSGAMYGIRIGFEAGREIYSADEGTNSYRYNIEDFLKEIE